MKRKESKINIEKEPKINNFTQRTHERKTSKANLITSSTKRDSNLSNPDEDFDIKMFNTFMMKS